MPQMAPLNWLELFFYFIMIYILFNTMNFFIFNYQIKFFKKEKKSTLFNWKW
uniref:ATP synthase complex subunit 8 n=1 Tax=Cerambycidae sp. 3 KM-2017 TaxID=2219288 RepID=A0A346RFG9_9CUCU|nr:ATP synthase F0 subunit 8 [Cerambycidae sp. 3 KM-2017]